MTLVERSCCRENNPRHVCYATHPRCTHRHTPEVAGKCNLLFRLWKTHSRLRWKHKINNYNEQKRERQREPYAYSVYVGDGNFRTKDGMSLHNAHICECSMWSDTGKLAFHSLLWTENLISCFNKLISCTFCRIRRFLFRFLVVPSSSSSSVVDAVVFVLILHRNNVIIKRMCVCRTYAGSTPYMSFVSSLVESSPNGKCIFVCVCVSDMKQTQLNVLWME